jgi:cytochrome P450
MTVFTDDMRRNPYPLYQLMGSTSPVIKLPGFDLWMILDYDGVKRAHGDHEAFGSRVSAIQRNGLDWLVFMEPPRHTHLRALISRAFTPRSIAGLEPRVREISRSLLDEVAGRGEMDLVAEYAEPLPLMVIAEMIGLPAGDWHKLRGWSGRIMDLALTLVGDEAEARAASASFAAADVQMRDYLERLVSARRAAPRDDLLTRLIMAEVDGATLTFDEIVYFIQLLLVAGAETTSNLIDNAILCLVEHPGEMARLLVSPELIPSAIEEVLRYRSPAQVTVRATRRDVEICGQVIPEGKMVLAVIGSANRDPKQFRDPDRFDIGRDPNPHLAFGHGIHFCLGAPLSRLEAKVALADLLGRLRHIELASSEPWEPRRAFNVHGPARLPIRFAAG